MIVEARTDGISLSQRHDNENDLDHLIEILIALRRLRGRGGNYNITEAEKWGQGEFCDESRVTGQHRVSSLPSLGSVITDDCHWSCYHSSDHSWWCLETKRKCHSPPRGQTELRMMMGKFGNEKKVLYILFVCEGGNGAKWLTHANNDMSLDKRCLEIRSLSPHYTWSRHYYAVNFGDTFHALSLWFPDLSGLNALTRSIKYQTRQ